MKKPLNNIGLFLLVLCSLTFALTEALSAQQQPAPAQQAEPGKTEKYEVQKEIYYYQSEMQARRDPFKPLTITDEDKKPDEDLPPLQKFDISQMKLFAVVLTEEAQYAMILLPDGKYYTVKKGDPIGIHDGYVVGMALDNIRIVEKLRNYRNEVIEKDAFLRLREEEGE